MPNNQTDPLDEWFKRNLISLDKETNELTVKFSGYYELQAAINAEIAKAVREARLEEVKLCQGKKLVSKERYLQNRQGQLEYELSKLTTEEGKEG